MPRKSTNIDMTAMCDVAFLLLTFFMLATKFKKEEPVTVKTPASISEIPIPDTDIMLITVDPKGRVFFSIDNQAMRKDLIQSISTGNNLGLNDQQIKSFTYGASIGVPFNQLGQYLAAPPNVQEQYDATAPGIPADTTEDLRSNELYQWIRNARQVSGNRLRVCIKTDADTKYPEYKKVISTLEKLKIFKFNLITDLKETPAGTAAYEAKMAGKSKSKH